MVFLFFLFSVLYFFLSYHEQSDLKYVESEFVLTIFFHILIRARVLRKPATLFFDFHHKKCLLCKELDEG